MVFDFYHLFLWYGCHVPLMYFSSELMQGHWGRPQSKHRSDVYSYIHIKAKCQSTEGGIVKGKY